MCPGWSQVGNGKGWPVHLGAGTHLPAFQEPWVWVQAGGESQVGVGSYLCPKAVMPEAGPEWEFIMTAEKVGFVVLGTEVVVPGLPSWGLTLLPPGTVLAVLGSVGDDGKFSVEDHCFAGPAPQTPAPPLDSDR